MNNKLNKNREFEEKGLTDIESVDSLTDPFEQPNILTPVMS